MESAPADDWQKATCEGSFDGFKMLKKQFKDESNQEETRYVLGLRTGVRVVLSSFGATVTSILCPDSKGEISDVVLGFDTRAEYDHQDNPYCGAIVGRVANRIKNAEFKADGETIQVAKNCMDKHHLHGGIRGYSHRFWDSEVVQNGVKFSLVSKDGDEGYPGGINVTVVYTLV